MTVDPIVRTAVVGAGTMGNGIAEVLATAGKRVVLVDVSPAALERGMQVIRDRLRRRVQKKRMTAEEMKQVLDRIESSVDLSAVAEAQLVIEAVVERLDVKKSLFSQLDEITDLEAILATNTSSLSVTAIASATKHPERVIGLHFFNPAPVMPLVEVVHGPMSEREVVDQAMAFVKEIGKDPVKVTDTPGFLVNRVARSFHSEAYRLVGDHVAEKRQVDRILRAAGFPMGPFELQDLIGLDINYAASCSVYEGYFHDPRFRPHPHQRQLVDSGSLGKKAGRGHYRYE
ncbi:hypothetical protein JIR001_07550 [Polycladomyces abyssicola]|uniref:3-hydroxybutyryl-CoA dehydrogenase n=1 Tax=Polycladomyces abyssicola TaxID=1125966 RepID=A0A8D5ZMK9_9BACL|nr:3-hydroxyacyl-CoA dehydrogenase NAD-binding domain-containing protein [Polycladomyces abyssicola]BCU80972.1 hypothetical protein JIR001_07550 [Polycladomyces abyssicola]